MPTHANGNGHPSPRSQRASIRDVALRAGVSISTVSYAINRNKFVRPETRQRVLAIAEEMGYVASAQARAMRRGPQDCVGLLLTSNLMIDDPAFVGAVNSHLLLAAAEENFTLVSEALGDDRPPEAMVLPRIVSQRRVSGLMLMGAFTAAQFTEICSWNLPVCVLHAPPFPGAQAPLVQFDVDEGVSEAVQYLLALGHRRIALVHGPLAYPANVLKKAGYEAALRSVGLEPAPQYVVETGAAQDNFSGAFDATHRLLAQPQRPTAIVYVTDWFAVGGLHAATQRGLRVPEDLSIVGHDDTFMARQCRPALTSINLDLRASARAALDIMVRKILDRPVAETVVHIRPKLVRRDSCAVCSAR